MPTYSEYRAAEARALAKGSGDAGGFLVPDDTACNWFDMLRVQSVVLSTGPVIVEANSATQGCQRNGRLDDCRKRDHLAG